MEVESEARMPLRMPGGLRDRLRKAATAERRSMNSQIIVLLERALAEAEAEAKQGEAA